MFLDPEASQENLKRPEKAPKRHPKRHPKVVQNLVKKWLKSETKTEQNEQQKTMAHLKKIALTRAFFQRLGLLKTLTSKKKNGPKMIQKWFKIAQVV